jgi:hypothetical protein
MIPVTAHRARVEILLFTFTGPCAGLEGGLRQDHGLLCLYLRVGLVTWNHHSVHPSSLSPFLVSQLLFKPSL